MAESVIYVKGTRAAVRRACVQAVAAASGHTQDAQEAADALQTRIGMTALAHIRDAFVQKSHGGADETGLTWPKLSPKTIAYNRRHPGAPASSVRAAFRPSWMLSEAQRKKWWVEYSRGLAMFKGDPARASKRAWVIAKGGGAKTLIGVYGATQVDILRDLGLLLNSLSPGVSPGSVDHQVFRIGAGEVIIGTNRVGASAHHRGIPGRLPQRKLWPDPENWPASWWDDVATSAREGFIDVLLFFLRRAA